MPQVEILSEQETREGPGGWVFEAQSLDDGGKLRQHRITLSWADYNLWSSDGADQPARVAEAALLFLLNQANADSIGARFDASVARRRYPQADVEIPKLITK